MPWVDFAKGQRKDDVAQQFLARFTDEEGVLFVGRAQEKARVFRTQRRRNPSTGESYPGSCAPPAFINFFYFYCVDADFGPFFLKFSTYFPYTAKLCLLWRRLHKMHYASSLVMSRGSSVADRGSRHRTGG